MLFSYVLPLLVGKKIDWTSKSDPIGADAIRMEFFDGLHKYQIARRLGIKKTEAVTSLISGAVSAIDHEIRGLIYPRGYF